MKAYFLRLTISIHIEIVQLSVDDSKCRRFKLKKNAYSKISKISNQLYQGTIHAITVFNLSNINLQDKIYNFNDKVTIKYYVGTIEKEILEAKRYGNKVIPGNPTADTNTLLDFKQNKIKFKKYGQNTIFNIETLFFDEDNNDISSFKKYYREYTLQVYFEIYRISGYFYKQ